MQDVFAKAMGNLSGFRSEASPLTWLMKIATNHCLNHIRTERAEDAMQDVFARALTHLKSFRNEASPLTWLMKIATHHCLNELRGERAGWRGSFERQERARGEGDGGAVLLETRELVRTLLSRFDAETQAAAIHYHVDEMTLEEVAEIIGRSVPTVRKRLESVAALAGKEIDR